MKKSSIFLCSLGIISLVIATSILVFNDNKKINLVSGSRILSEHFDKIYINTNSNDVQLISDDIENTVLEYVADEKFTYDFSKDIEDNKNVLKINQIKNKKIDLDFQKKSNSQIKILIPKKNVENIVIKNSIGNINIKNLVCSNIEIHSNIGDISLNDINTKKSIIKSKIGNIELNKIICDNIEISNFIGDMVGNICGHKNDYKIISKTNIGDNNLLNTFDGEKRLKIKTKIGDININFKN